MSISFSGLGSGMDYSSWIDQLVEIKMQAVTTLENQKTTLTTKQSTLNTLKSTFNSLRNSLQTISDSKYGGSMDIFSSNTATSSNSAFVTATVTSNAARQDLSIYVKQLATATVATGTKPAGKEITENTVFSELSNKGAKTGKFSLYSNNQKYEIEIEQNDTLGDIKEKLENISGISVNISDGKFTIASENTLNLGSNADTSNFASILGLTTYSEATHSYTSNHTITELKDSITLLDADSGFAEGLTAGTFTIGSAEFTIDENTTLKSLIATINNSNDAGVKASFDYASGKLTLTSTTMGSMNINIEAGTSNITDILGFTDNGKIANDSQVSGENAKFTVNGTEFTSFSNTVTSDVTGLTGVTLNLNSVMSEDSGATVISIKQDTDKIYDQISQIITNLNTAIYQVDATTAADEDGAAILAYETQLTNLRNSLRTSALEGQILSDGTYSSLAVIGISTGAAGQSAEADTNQLVIDESTLRNALETNPQMVKEILTGTGSDGRGGVINNMLNTVVSSLDSTYGYFTTRANSIDSEISKIEEKIEKRTTQAETYRSQLERQFKAMDNAIAKLQQQYSGIDFSSS